MRSSDAEGVQRRQTVSACPAPYFVPSTLYFVPRWRSHRLGGMTERTKVAVLKTAVGFTPYRGFESHSLRRTALSHVPRSEGKRARHPPAPNGDFGVRNNTARIAGLGHSGLPVMGGVQLTRWNRYPNGDLVYAIPRPRSWSIAGVISIADFGTR